jgi:hypothetical protein
MKFASCLILSATLTLAAFTAPAQTNLSPASTNTPPTAVKPKARSRPYSGSVISVDRDAKTFTITLEKGKMKILHITAKTKFKKDGAPAAFADLDLGESVKGTAHLDESSNLVASTVNILVPKPAPDDAAQ